MLNIFAFWHFNCSADYGQLVRRHIFGISFLQGF